MIIELIFNLIKAVILFVIGLLPSFPSYEAFTGSFEGLLPVFSAVSLFVSLDVIVLNFGFLILIYNFNFFYNIVMWVVRKIPVSID